MAEFSKGRVCRGRVCQGPSFLGAEISSIQIFWCPNKLYLVSFAGMTLNKCTVIWIAMLIGGLLCRESHPLCRLKNPTVVHMITCRVSSCKIGVYNVHLLIIFERWCSSTCMYRTRERKKKGGGKSTWPDRDSNSGPYRGSTLTMKLQSLIVDLR